MKPPFTMIFFLRLFSLAVVLMSLFINPLIMKMWGAVAQVTPMLMANAILFTGILGVLVTNILAEQKAEIDKLKAEVAVLSKR